MREPQTVQDPLGHKIRISETLIKNGNDWQEISQVITTPGFIINGIEQLYFFGVVGGELTLMVEVRLVLPGYEATALVENPTVEYISSLLQKGQLITLEN